MTYNQKNASCGSVNQKPIVSFILPAYKRNFLKEAIDSILAQTYRDFELVVVDDKSPQKLYDVFREYSWERSAEVLPGDGLKWIVDGVSVRYYQNTENIGRKDLVAAWNHAMEYATGTWCVLASDDNVYMPGYLEEMIRLMKKYPSCDLFQGRTAHMDINGNIVAVSVVRAEFKSTIDFLYERGVLRLDQSMPDFMFRVVAYRRIGGFVHLPLAWYADDATWYALSGNGVCFSNKVLFSDRASPFQISSRSDNVFEKTQAAELFKKWVEEFVAKLVPNDEMECVMLKNVVQRIKARVNEQTRYDMFAISFATWLKCFRIVTGTRGQILRLLYERFSPLMIVMRALRIMAK